MLRILADRITERPPQGLKSPIASSVTAPRSLPSGSAPGYHFTRATDAEAGQCYLVRQLEVLGNKVTLEPAAA